MQVNSTYKKIIAAVLALLLWQWGADSLNQGLLLASPVEAARRLIYLFGEGSFWQALGLSFVRIALGFLFAVFLGSILALIAGRFSIFETLLHPYMAAIRSVPVVSFIIIVLWIFSDRLSIFISFLMALPIVYTQILQGIKSADRSLCQAADVFKVPFFRRVKYIWLPAIKPFLLSACSVGSGLAFKAGLAAEVIGIPAKSVGEAMYMAKVHFDTAELMAWTVAMVLVSILFEKAITALVKLCFRRLERS